MDNSFFFFKFLEEFFLLNSNIQFLFCVFIKHKNKKERNKHKNQTYYFFDDMINIKRFDSDLLKIDKKSCIYQFITLMFITLDISQRKFLSMWVFMV